MSSRRIVTSALLAAATMAAGCNQTPRAAKQAIALYAQNDYAAAAAAIKPSTLKKDENFVLDNCRYGSCALAGGDLADAENAFMAAYEVMNGVNTNNGGRTLGATLVFEGVKVWKGEPFERAMAHYYLGVIFLIKHDYQNARAAFQNSLFKLEENASKDNTESYQKEDSNFAMGYFGLGYCYMRMGRQDLALQNFQLAVKVNPAMLGVVTQVQKPGINTLVFVDGGWGPQRAPNGWYDEESAFGPTPAEAGPVPQLVAYVDAQPVSGANDQMVDTLAMAQQQKWQDIDTIRKAKAVIGTGAVAAGAGMTAYGAQKHDRGMEWAGIGTALVGGALIASSRADLRYWEMLPRNVYVMPLALPPGPHAVAVKAGNSQTPAAHFTVGGTVMGSALPTVPGRPADPTQVRDIILYFRLPAGPRQPLIEHTPPQPQQQPVNPYQPQPYQPQPYQPNRQPYQPYQPQPNPQPYRPYPG